ncbi:alpha 1,2 mannosyltransferase, partial [Coemansia sp. RSA 25]
MPRLQRALYAALLVARVLLSVLPGYIHPDEFFQGPEIAASDILHTTALRTWEFTSSAPVRSIVPIYAFAGPPMLALRMLGVQPTAWRVFAGSRVFMALLSLAVDAGVYRAIKGRRCARPTMLALASSYCLAVFHVHTFANAFASAVLAACFGQLARIADGRGRGSLAVLGGGLALGTFTHVSFPMFAVPLGVAALIARRGELARSVARMAAGGVLVAAAIVAADSAYYGGQWPTLTVANNLAYNTRRDNLAQHGIQPRYMHALVNVPLLFGPLCLVVRRPRGLVEMAAAASAVTGVALLSVAPHQEARFLLPALPALAICARPRGRLFWCAWAAFNAALFVVFGALHQAGVVPVVTHLAQSVWRAAAQCHVVGADALCAPAAAAAASAIVPPPGLALTTTVLLVATYMAPRHLLAQTADATARVTLVDLVGMDYAQVSRRIGDSVLVNATLAQSSVAAAAATANHVLTLVVVPGSVNIERIAPPESNYHLIPVFRYAPHVNLDHMAETLQHP